LCASDLLSAIISGCEFLLRHICKSQLQQSLRTGRSGDWNPSGDEIFRTCPDQAYQAHTMGTKYFMGLKPLGSGIDHPPHLEPRLKKE